LILLDLKRLTVDVCQAAEVESMSSFTPITDTATSSVVSSNAAAATASTGSGAVHTGIARSPSSETDGRTTASSTGHAVQSPESHADRRVVMGSPAQPVDLTNHQVRDMCVT